MRASWFVSCAVFVGLAASLGHSGRVNAGSAFTTDDRNDNPAGKPAKPKADPTKDDLTQQVLEAIKGNDLSKAVTLLQKVLKDEPKNKKALSLLAKIKMDQAAVVARPECFPLFLEAASLTRRQLQLIKDPTEAEKEFAAQAFYYEACTYALKNEPAKALASLTDAYNVGFAQSDMLETDEDLESIRSRPEFKKLVQDVEARAIPIAFAHAQKMLAENKPFPFAFQLPSIDGKTVSLADLKGKVVIVDVWGTWCYPCRMEIPHLVKLHQRYRDKGFDIVGINYERVPDDQVKEKVRKFVKKNGVPYRCVIGDDKTQERIPGFEGFPTTLFIDREGKVRLKVVGYHSFIDLDAIVSTLLEEKTQTP